MWNPPPGRFPEPTVEVDPRDLAALSFALAWSSHTGACAAWRRRPKFCLSPCCTIFAFFYAYTDTYISGHTQILAFCVCISISIPISAYISTQHIHMYISICVYTCIYTYTRMHESKTRFATSRIERKTAR